MGTLATDRSAAALALSIGVAAVAFHRWQTGMWFPGSGVARVIMGRQEAFGYGPLAINAKVFVRLLAYLPLTIACIVGTRWVIQQSASTERRGLWRFTATVFWTFCVLYSTVLGAAHLGRYMVFLVPFYVLLAAAGVDAMRGSKILRRSVCAAALAWLSGVFIAESWERFHLGSPQSLFDIVKGVTERSAHSSLLLEALNAGQKRPVVLAYQEVQIRNRLDDRFVIRSLDGRVDPLLLGFVQGGFFDHVGYIRARQVDYVMEIPNYNRSSSEWSLARLGKLRSGESLEQKGVRFTRLKGFHAYRVEVIR